MRIGHRWPSPMTCATLVNGDYLKRLTLHDVFSLLAQEVPLSNCDLCGLDLAGMDFSRTSFRMKVDFGRCDLRGANLAGADLTDAEFYEANLQRANLTAAKVSLSALGEAPSLVGAIMPDGSNYNLTRDEEKEDEDDSI